MRKFTLILLLASSAAPAMALPGDGNRRSNPSSQSEQSEQSDDRPQRAERSDRSERREAREQPQRQFQIERQHSGQQGNDAAVGMRERFQQAQQQQGMEESLGERIQRYRQQEQQQVQGNATRSERLERYRQRQLEANQQAQGGTLLPRQGRIRTIPPTTPQVGQDGPVRRDAHVGRRYDRDNRHRWSNHWRNDHRYNWRRYRDRNRSIFRIGFYFDPFGYNYRRFGLGSYLYPNYYQSNYWINDPWRYRLPPAYGPYRWIRYHNDAVLIDTWNGEVVDVIYGFFW